MSHSISAFLAPYKTIDAHQFVFDTGSMTWVPATGGGTSSDVVVTNTVTVTATDFDIRDLTAAQDSVTAFQGTIPWVVSGTVAITGDVNVTQGTSPWVIVGSVAAVQSGVWSVGRTWDLNFATDQVDASGSLIQALQSGSWTVNAIQSGSWTVSAVQSGSWTVNAVQSGAWSVGRTWTLDFATDQVDASGSTVTALQGTSPWVVSGTVSIGGSVSVTQGTSPWVVSGTVAATQSGAWSVGRTWDLSFAADQVDASGSTVIMQATDPAGPTVESINTNSTATLLASAVRAATTSSAAQVNRNWRGVHVTLNITAAPGAEVDTLIPRIQAQNPVTAAWYDLLVGTVITGTSTGLTVLKVGAGIAPLAGGAAQDVLPRNWRVTVTHTTAVNWTYSVGANLCV